MSQSKLSLIKTLFANSPDGNYYYFENDTVDGFGLHPYNEELHELEHELLGYLRENSLSAISTASNFQLNDSAPTKNNFTINVEDESFISCSIANVPSEDDKI